MDEDPVARLAVERFGIRYLYPYQRLAIANALDAIAGRKGHDEPDDGHEAEEPRGQLVLLPTGFGKSLCFQIPALAAGGLSVVVYPLLGLMADQARSLASRGIAYAVLKGGMDRPERDEALRPLSPGESRIIITNPEALAAPATLKAVAALKPGHLVVDEAHCVAEWGDSFRPSYLELGRAAAALRPKFISAFTATASPPIARRVAEVLFGDRPWRLVEGPADRPAIRYAVRPALSMRRELRRAIEELRRPLIVFVRSRAGAELVAEGLRLAFPTVDSRFYHAGLGKGERKACEDWFFETDDGILAATCAYGMGIDKPNVRSVVHYGPPASAEAYLQEAGRGGRDGAPSTALLLYPAADAALASLAERGEGRSALMARYAASASGCRRRYLLSALGSREAETAPCGNCDRCDGSEPAGPEGLDAVTALARRHPRRLYPHEAAAALSQDLPLRPGSGALSSWLRDEIREGVEAAITLGAIRRIGRGPWKGRLVPARPSDHGGSRPDRNAGGRLRGAEPS